MAVVVRCDKPCIEEKRWLCSLRMRRAYAVEEMGEWKKSAGRKKQDKALVCSLWTSEDFVMLIVPGKEG